MASSSSRVSLLALHVSLSLFAIVPTPSRGFSASSSSRPNRISNLLDWASKNQIQVSPRIDLRADEATGVGWFFSSKGGDSKSNSDLLLTVPSSVALTVESPGRGPDDETVVEDFFSSDDRDLRKSFQDDLPWFVEMAAYLLKLKYVDSTAKKAKDEVVDYRPWLDALPQKLDTPIHWTQEEISELQYDYLVDSVKAQKRKWEGLYEKLQFLLSESTASRLVTWDDFVWGCEMARSRAFSGTTTDAFDPKFAIFTLILVAAYLGLGLGTLEQAANGAGVVFSVAILKDFVLPKLFKKKSYVICPVIDMCNHNSANPQGQVSFEFFGDAYSLSLLPGGASSSAQEGGQQLYISYGSRSNDQLLQYYGFVEPANPCDVYIMPPLREWDINALEEATGRTVGPGRLEKIDRTGLLGKKQQEGKEATEEDADDSRNSDGSGGDDDDDILGAKVANPKGGVVITRSTGVDPAVMQALRALLSTDEEWEAAGQAVGNFCEVVNQQNEACARLAARKAIQNELDGKPTTLQEDEDLLRRMESEMSKKTDSASYQEKLAMMFRIEKKRLLIETIQDLQ